MGAHLSRRDCILPFVDKAGLGIEIGPSHNPIAPKREGFNVHVIDHMSREQLVQKYGAHAVRLERIEEVDFVWTGGQSYAELTGRRGGYDWIIASHVIEHTPDLIAFLADCEAVLKETGVLCLVVPDKRFCFDRFRPVTGLARVIDADMSNAAFPFRTARQVSVVWARVLASRISYAGELGWELYIPPEVAASTSSMS